MKPIQNFDQLTSHLKTFEVRKRIVVVCADDLNTEYAMVRAIEEGFAEFLLVGNSEVLAKYTELTKYAEYVQVLHIEDPEKAAVESVRIVHEKRADILMKGIINTDILLRAILDKDKGLLPQGKVLTHLSVMQVSSYPKLLFFSDAAVIPRPTLQQRIEMIWYAIRACHAFGITQPRISLIHCTEKVSTKFPHSLDYVNIVELAEAGEFGDIIIDGPLDVLTSCDRGSAAIKGIASPIEGEADVLIFPNIESGNTFHKGMTLFAKADVAGMLQGPICPVVLTSRSDSGTSKYNSLAMACLACK